MCACRYAARIEGPTHEWGGQLELRALGEAVRCVIVVHSAGEAPLRLVPPPPQRDVGVSTSDGGMAHRRLLPELHISYHVRQYLLGQHYNSVVSLVGD